jgi:(p)ppGpp synthase/HD superfamily hydrolase
LNPAEARAVADAVADAVAFAVEAHAGQYRKSGEPYVVHPIETACILAEMKVDADTVRVFVCFCVAHEN